MRVGIDFGSRFVKVVTRTAQGGFAGTKYESLQFYKESLVRGPDGLKVDMDRLGLSQSCRVIVTGYGKTFFDPAIQRVTEIRAHFRGAVHQTGLTDFVCVEMGGQDTKIIQVKGGRVFDFITNDRCAAGTGRYLENMAALLRVSLEELSTQSEHPATITNTCAIFGETEVINHVIDGVPMPRIMAGINDSIARRVYTLVRKYRPRAVVFCGGVAINQAVGRLIEKRLNVPVVVPEYPQLNGAIGCLLAGTQS
ncbi:MAG: 2-hydroxyglutaryl-CoA dehydratase [Deltaproteobacteria bacterium]|nr:2-hydroxyglutaryl-CoA dehydratase [Deltaproteobacteria bacterium]